MKRNIFILIIIGLSLPQYGYVQNSIDTSSVEYLMSKGRISYLEGNIEQSISFYEKVLALYPSHYDAIFAQAVNYYRIKDYKKSLDLYEKIYFITPMNTEVLNGISRCLIKTENYKKAKKYLALSLEYNPKDISVYFDFAFVYMVLGDLDSARYFYQEIVKLDVSNAQGYAGIGKMYYWKNKPKTALKYYEKAIKLDSQNEEINKIYQNIKNDLSYQFSMKIMRVTEEESSYNIEAYIQKYGLEKRINDCFSISLNTLWDYSSRNNLYFDDVYRWYDNTWVVPTLILKSHRISLFSGFSANDNRITSYGLTWNASFNAGKFKFKNYLTAAYDYFYYWNKVGQEFAQNTLGITFKRVSLWSTFKYAVIKDNIVWDVTEKTDNPFSRYNIELKYELFKNPKITVGVNQFNMNYTYSSPLYYSPDNRTVSGFLISNQYTFKKFYTYEEFLYGIDNENVNQNSGSAEIGYDNGKFSVGLSGNYFKNEFYKSSTIQLTIKKIF